MIHVLIVDVTSMLPAKLYGGTERVILGLGKSLIKCGCKVSYLIKKGSSLNFANVINYDLNKTVKSQIPKDVDIVHYHSFVGFEKLDIPYVFTMHGNGNTTDVFDINTIFLSENHAKRHNANCYVYNGLDWSLYPKVKLNLKREYYHFLGKASWRIKNLKDSCKIIVMAKERLQVLGGEKFTIKNYKRGAIYKLHPRIRYRGMVNDVSKMEIMSKSKGLIFPVLWNEPFGLAIIESLYAGCPVFGSSIGSVKELVKADVGLTSDSITGLIEGVKNNNFSPKKCHEYAKINFSSDMMAKKYLDCYLKVIDGKSLNDSIPYVEKDFSISESNLLSK